MRENIVKNKAYAFVVSLYPLYHSLRERREYTIANQLWRSGTSISANIEEAVSAFSRSDFSFKLSIALKEARETSYWLRLLRDIQLLSNIDTHLDEINQVISMLTSTIKTMQLKTKP